MQTFQLNKQLDQLTLEQRRASTKRVSEMERLSRHLATVQATTLPLEQLSLGRYSRMI